MNSEIQEINMRKKKHICHEFVIPNISVSAALIILFKDLYIRSYIYVCLYIVLEDKGKISFLNTINDYGERIFDFVVLDFCFVLLLSQVELVHFNITPKCF